MGGVIMSTLLSAPQLGAPNWINLNCLCGFARYKLLINKLSNSGIVQIIQTGVALLEPLGSHSGQRALSPTAAMKKHNLQWAFTTAVVLILLLQVMGTSSGLALDAQHALVPHKESASHQKVSVTVQPKVSGPKGPAFDFGAKYRPPIINFKYQGGLILTKPIHIYIIWYGAWATNEKNLIKTALSSLTPASAITQFPNLSNLWKVMTKYYQQPSGQSRKYLTTHVLLAGEADDGATVKTINSDSDPLLIVIDNVNSGRLPIDIEQGIYFVLTASDISFSNSPNYCGWHTSVCVQVGGTPANCSSPANNLVYSFVPMPVDKFAGCNIFNPALIPGTPPNFAVSTSGALDSAINVIMHELLETAVDPYPNSMPAWFHDRSENSETADLCAYTFVAGEWFYCQLPHIYYDFDYSKGQCAALGSLPGATDPPRSLKDPRSGVRFNQYGIGGSQFMVQRMWSLDNKGCVSQPEAHCSSGVVQSRNIFSGKIQRGLFFNGVGLQAYAPGQNCRWRLTFTKQVKITFTFNILALAFDDLDFVTITKPNNVLVKKLTRMGRNIVVTATGNDFTVAFVTYGGRSPYPISAGFIMYYKAV